MSSRDADPARRVAPLDFAGDSAAAQRRLKDLVASLPRVRIVDEQPGYLHAEFSSALFGFVDDVEFVVDENEQAIHVRSASRTGYWDMGVNRARVESIREQFRRAAGP